MKSRKMGENISREWDKDPSGQDLWRALQLIERDASAGTQELENLSGRGSSLSMMYLGHAFLIGRYGLEKNPVSGEKWLRNSVKAGSIEALYVLAKHFQESDRGAEAMGLFKQAAELGYSPAMFAVGWSYYFGQDVGRDLDRAHEYFKKAADAGHLYGVLWEARTFRERQISAFTWIRSLLIRVPLVFRLAHTLSTYPSSDRLRK
jgi:TPR repeat protein